MDKGRRRPADSEEIDRGGPVQVDPELARVANWNPPYELRGQSDTDGFSRPYPGHRSWHGTDRRANSPGPVELDAQGSRNHVNGQKVDKGKQKACEPVTEEFSRGYRTAQELAETSIGAGIPCAVRRRPLPPPRLTTDVYVLEDGQYKPAFPTEFNKPFVAPELAHLMSAEGVDRTAGPAARSRGAGTMSWNLAMNASLSMHHDAREVAQGTALHHQLPCPTHEDSTLNHSRPTNGMNKGPLPPDHPNRIYNPPIPNAPQPYPNHTTDPEFTLLEPTTTSTPITPTTQIRNHENTIDTLARLTYNLHQEVDSLRLENSDIKKEAIQVINMFETMQHDIATKVEVLNAQRDEIQGLKSFVDLGNRVVGETYRREWELWMVASRVKTVKSSGAGRLKRVFSLGRKGGTGEWVRKEDVEGVVEVAVRNLRTLKEEVEGMVDLVGVLKGEGREGGSRGGSEERSASGSVKWSGGIMVEEEGEDGDGEGMREYTWRDV